METQDRRKHSRLNKKVAIRYRVNEAGSEEEVMCQATMLDYSGGGVRFETNRFHNKNMPLLLEIEIDGWEVDKEWPGQDDPQAEDGPLWLLGMVMWCQEKADRPGFFELGVRFTGRVKKPK